MLRIKIGNNPIRPLAELQCTSATLVYNNIEPDQLTLVSKAYTFTSMQFAVNTVVDLYSDDERIFRGIILDSTANKAADGDSVTLNVRGLTALLESDYFTTSWIDDKDSGVVDYIADKTKAQLFGKRYYYGFMSFSGIYVSDTMVQFFSAFEYIALEFIKVFRERPMYDLFDVGATSNDFPNQQKLPYEEKSTPTFREVLSAVQRWHPDLFGVWAYAEHKPLLEFKAASVLPVRDVPITRCKSVSITPGVLARPTEIILRAYETGYGTGLGSTWELKRSTDYTQTYGDAPYYNRLVIPFDLSDAAWYQHMSSGWQSNMMSDALTRIAAIARTDTTTGSVTIVDRNYKSRYIGKRISIVGSRDNLESLVIPVQSEQVDLMTGERQLTVGHSNQMDVSDYLEVVKYIFEQTDLGTYKPKVEE